jgi:hypothetical protein
MKTILAAIITTLTLALLLFYLLQIRPQRDARLALDPVITGSDNFVAYVFDNSEVYFKRIDADRIDMITKTGGTLSLKITEDFKRNFFADWQASQITNVVLTPPTGCNYTVIETFLKQVDNAQDVNDIIANIECATYPQPVLYRFIATNEK